MAVSQNYQSIASEFEDMVEQRDFRGFAALAGVGALGGVLAEMFQDRVAPRLNQPREPNTTRGLAGSFLIKSAAAVLLGMAAIRSGRGTLGVALAAAGVGAAVDAGVDLIEAGDRLRAQGPQVQRRTTSGSSKPRAGANRTRAAQPQYG